MSISSSTNNAGEVLFKLVVEYGIDRKHWNPRQWDDLINVALVSQDMFEFVMGAPFCNDVEYLRLHIQRLRAIVLNENDFEVYKTHWRWNQLESQLKFIRTGCHCRRFQSDNVVYRYRYEYNHHVQPHGVWKEWYHSSGRLAIVINHQNGNQHGQELRYADTLEHDLILFQNWQYGRLHGECREYSSQTGRLLKHCYYKCGKLHGEYRQYFTDEQCFGNIHLDTKLYLHCFFHESMLHGVHEEFDTNKNLMTRRVYEHGCLVGSKWKFL